MADLLTRNDESFCSNMSNGAGYGTHKKAKSSNGGDGIGWIDLELSNLSPSETGEAFFHQNDAGTSSRQYATDSLYRISEDVVDIGSLPQRPSPTFQI